MADCAIKSVGLKRRKSTTTTIYSAISVIGRRNEEHMLVKIEKTKDNQNLHD